MQSESYLQWCISGQSLSVLEMHMQSQSYLQWYISGQSLSVLEMHMQCESYFCNGVLAASHFQS